MNRRHIYAIYDNKAQDIISDQIWIERHNVQAIRNFQQAYQNPKSLVNKYIEDYDLVCLGEMNDEGHITGHDFTTNPNGTATHLNTLFQIILRGKDLAALQAPVPDANQTQLEIAR